MQKSLAPLITIGNRLRGGFRRMGQKGNIDFPALVRDFDVIIMKHCYNASDVLGDIGDPDPLYTRKSLENYKSVYRALRERFDCHQDTLFIIWTLPPRHRLFDPCEGNRDDNASGATRFSDWLLTDFLTEKGAHPNIRVWDFRNLVTDKDTNFLRTEYEKHHDFSDSHPNETANRMVAPLFVEFLHHAMRDFDISTTDSEGKSRVIFLHHSTGRNVYRYAKQKVLQRFDRNNRQHELKIEISDAWYPAGGNMPADYYRAWLMNNRI